MFASTYHDLQLPASGVLRAMVVFFFAAVPALSHAQQPTSLQLDPQLQITQYIHDTWQVENGLPQSSVYAFLREENGYLWLGTQSGLARFDGLQFTVFNRSNTAGLRSNEIRAFEKDPEGGFWIGTSEGLTRYKDGQFTTYTKEDGLPSNAIHSLARGERGTLWIGTLGGGLARFDGSSFFQLTREDGLTGSYVLALQTDSSGTLWIGTEAGLSRYRNGKLSPYQSNHLEGRVIEALHMNQNGSMWVGTNQGLVHLQPDRVTTYTKEDGLCSNNISTLLKDQAGALWIGTLDNGLCRYYEGAFSSFTVEDGLTHNRIRALHVGREGGLWIGTEMGGLNRLRMGKFAPLSKAEGLSHDVVLSVLEDQQGAMWIGTLGGGLNRIDPGGHVTHFTAKDGLPSNQVSALHESPGGTLWVGTQGGGLCRLNKPAARLPFSCFTTSDGLSSNYIFSLHENRQGTLWVGTDVGLNRLEDGQITHYTTEDGLSANLITGLLEDRSGNLWIGTYGGGLNRLSGDRFITYDIAHGLSSASVVTLHESPDGTLWIGTQGGGLCRLRNGLFACFTKKDGLHSDDILQIQEDDQHHLWLGGMNSIARISTQRLSAYARGRRQTTLHPTVYDLKNVFTELNGGTQPASWRSRDGRLWFSTIRGAAVIDPGRIATNPFPPPVKLKSLEVNGRPVPLEEDLTLPPGSRDLGFHYTGLSFAAPKQVHFQYQLKGYDKQWIEAGTRRKAFYTNLPPGEYAFQVRARNNDGVWNRTGAAMTFYVNPFFYETYWFYGLCLTGFGLLIAGAYHLRLRQVKTRELKKLVAEQTSELRTRERELQDLNHDLEKEVQRQLDERLADRERYEHELISAKEKAEESARLKTSILHNMSHEIRTPITAILGYAEILEEELSNQALGFAIQIHQNGKRLLKTINSILDLSKLEANGQRPGSETFNLKEVVEEEVNLLSSIAQKKGIALRTELPSTAVEVSLNKHALTRILQNLAGNAIKFTDQGEVVARVGVREAAPYVQICDTGIGISEEFLPRLFNEFEQESSGLSRNHQGTGLGLAITKRLAETMGGHIAVESEKGAGTTFTVTFPDALAKPLEVKKPAVK